MEANWAGTPNRERSASLGYRQHAGLGMSLSPGLGGDTGNFVLFHIRQAGQDVPQILGRIQAVAAATAQDRVDDRATPARLRMANKQEVLFTNGGGTNRVLHAVIVDLHVA